MNLRYNSPKGVHIRSRLSDKVTKGGDIRSSVQLKIERSLKE